MRELGVRDGLGSQGGDAGSRRLDGILRVAHGCATSLCVCDFGLLRDLGRCPLLGFSISTSSRFALPVVEWSRPERSLEGAPGLEPTVGSDEHRGLEVECSAQISWGRPRWKCGDSSLCGGTRLPGNRELSSFILLAVLSHKDTNKSE